MKFAMLNHYIKKVIKNPFIIANYILIHSSLFNFMSDRSFIKLTYFFFYQKKLTLQDPKTFNEKIQWLKLYDRKEIHTVMADKYQAKKLVATMLGEEYTIPTLKVYDRVEDIKYEELPNQFVIKCTHDSGSALICRDKEQFEWIKAKRFLGKCMLSNYYYKSREWPYKNIKPRIITEPLLKSNTGGGL